MPARLACQVEQLRRCAAFGGLRACSCIPDERWQVVDGGTWHGEDVGTAASWLLALRSSLAPFMFLCAAHAVQI